MLDVSNTLYTCVGLVFFFSVISARKETWPKYSFAYHANANFQIEFEIFSFFFKKRISFQFKPDQVVLGSLENVKKKHFGKFKKQKMYHVPVYTAFQTQKMIHASLWPIRIAI